MRRVKNAINRGLRNTNGFSLVEIIAVLAIIAILATAVITVGRYALKRGRIGKAKATLEKLSLVIGLYKEDFGVYIPESIRTENGQSLSRVLDRLQWPSDYTDALGRKRSKPALNDYDKPSEILFFFLQEIYDVVNFNSASRHSNAFTAPGRQLSHSLVAIFRLFGFRWCSCRWILVMSSRTLVSLSSASAKVFGC